MNVSIQHLIFLVNHVINMKLISLLRYKIFILLEKYTDKRSFYRFDDAKTVSIWHLIIVVQCVLFDKMI